MPGAQTARGQAGRVALEEVAQRMALGQAETESRAYKEALEARVAELHQAMQPLPPAVVKLKEAVQIAGLSWT